MAPVASAEAVARALEPGTAGHLTESLSELRAVVPQAGEPGLTLLGRIGVVDPSSLEAYRASGGYRALTRAIELGPGRASSPRSRPRG